MKNKALMTRFLTIGICLATICVMVATWQGGSLFGSDFSWTNSSYAVEQAYDSAAFQVEEDSESNNIVTQEDQDDTQLADSSLPSDGLSAGGSTLSGNTVPSDEEIVVGSGGDAQGGNPSQGNGPSNGGNDPGPGGNAGGEPGWIIPPDNPSWEPDRIGDPNRFEEVQNPYDDDIGGALKDSLVRVVISGRGKVLVGEAMDVDRFVRPYIDGYVEVKRAATGNIERVALNKSMLKEFSYTEPKEGETETTVRLSYIDSAYGSRVVDVVCDVYEHSVSFDLPQENGADAVRFFNGDTFEIPADIRQAVLAGLRKASDGSLEELFIGWKADALSGAVVIDSISVPRALRSVSLVAQPAMDLNGSGYGHLRVEVQGASQTLVGIKDPDALSGTTLVVPEGITSIALASQSPCSGIERIELSSTVRDVDVASVVGALPDLEEWSTSVDNPLYSSTMNGYLTKKLDGGASGGSGTPGDERVSIESIPPAINAEGGIDIEASVVAFGKDAFVAFEDTSALYFYFESEEVRFEDWDSIPAGALMLAPLNSPFDRAYCRYLSAIATSNLALVGSLDDLSLVRNGGSYEVDDTGVVSFVQDDGKKLLAYVPGNVSGSFSVADGYSGIASTAFMDCEALSTIVLPGNMDFFETRSLFAKNLSNIVASCPETVIFGKGQSGTGASTSPAFAPRNEYPADFTILLSCDRSSECYTRWLDQLMLAWGNKAEAEAALICLGDTDGSIEMDDSTGSVYVRGSDRLVLCSVPAATSRLDIKQGTTDILPSALKGCSRLRIVQIPATVTDVGALAFEGCSSLQAVLYSDAALQGNTVDAWASQVGLTAASGCSSIRMLESSTGFTSDGEAAVYERMSNGLELAFVVTDVSGDLSLLPSTTSVAPSAAQGRSALGSISGFGSVVSIGADAFAGCTGLRHVDALSSVTTLGDRAFADSGISGTLSITGANLSIGQNSFARCSNLRELIVRGSVVTLGVRTFEGCDYLQKVDMGNASTSIATTGIDAFRGCQSLSSVTIAAALKRLGEGTFADCRALTSVHFTSSCRTTLTTIDNDAFRNCISLNGFTVNGLSALELLGDRFMYVDASALATSDRAPSSVLLTTRVTLPASLKSIGAYAFGNQVELATVEISGSDSKLTLVGSSAFAGCMSLRQVDLGVSVAPLVVGSSAFEGCSSLQRVTLPKTMTTVSEAAFKGCSSLSSFVLRGSGACAWAILGNEAFAGCSALNSIDLSLTRISLIGASAFSDCRSLTLVTLPETLSAIGTRAFAGCTALTTVSLLSTDPPSIGTQAFAGCDLSVLSIQVPQSQDDSVLDAYRNDPSWQAVLSDPSTGFDENSITSADPGVVVYEGASYRRTDSGLSLFEVNPAVVGSIFTPMSQASVIEAGAFEGCSSVVAVKIPASIKRIEAGAFAGCANLEIMAFEADRPAVFGGSLFGSASPNSHFKLYVPSGSTNWYGSVVELESYRIVTGGATFALQDGGLLFTSYNSAAVPSNLEVLFKVARSFSGTISLTSATDYIADGAAEGCTGIREVYLGGYCSTVGRRAFKGCTSLTHADLGPLDSNLTGLGESAFEGCTALKSLMVSGGNKVPIIPRSVTSFGPRTFKGCTSLAYVSLQGAVENIPEGFLEGCTSLGYLTAGSQAITSLKTFGDSCFKGCVSMTTAGASLTSFVNLTSIGKDAYSGCTNLSLVTLPQKLTSIGQGAFAGCSSVDAVAFNSASPLALQGTGLDSIVGQARVFVPLGAKDAWQAAFPTQPMILDEVSATYRAVSGNIYAETRYVSGTEGDLAFLATTKRASASGSVSVYQSKDLHVTAVNARALAGESHVKTFKAGSYCESIGDHAFDGTGGGTFTLDLSTSTVIPRIGTRIFGDSVAADGGIRIAVPAADSQEYIDALSVQLRTDYGMELQVASTSADKAYLTLAVASSSSFVEDGEGSGSLEGSDDELSVPGAPGVPGVSGEDAGDVGTGSDEDSDEVPGISDGVGTDEGADSSDDAEVAEEGSDAFDGVRTLGEEDRYEEPRSEG